jgi:hypothetical protein
MDPNSHQEQAKPVLNIHKKDSSLLRVSWANSPRRIDKL